MTQREQIAQLQAELAELRARLARLEPIPGLPASDDWSVRVGGQPVVLRALTPAQWAVALQDLPGFLFAYVSAQERGQSADEELLNKLVETAQRWILACAINPGEVQIERLTIPEALEAIRRISALNGVDSALGEMLQKKLRLSTPSTSALGVMASDPQRSSN
jgi:hypothetical protein